MEVSPQRPQPERWGSNPAHVLNATLPSDSGVCILTIPPEGLCICDKVAKAGRGSRELALGLDLNIPATLMDEDNLFVFLWELINFCFFIAVLCLRVLQCRHALLLKRIRLQHREIIQ